MITSFFPWQAKILSCHVSIQKVKSKEIKASAPPEFWRMKATNWFGVGFKWDDLMIWVKSSQAPLMENRDLKIVRFLFWSRAQKRWFVQALHDCSLDGSWTAPAQVDNGDWMVNSLQHESDNLKLRFKVTPDYNCFLPRSNLFICLKIY